VLIIFALAALAVLFIIGVVVVLPIMIVVSMVRAGRRRSAQPTGPASSPDTAFLDIVDREWPPDGDVLIA
jgi:hypothetical protein